MSTHSLLSPSTSDRWMNCPGSVRWSQGLTDGGSIHAEGGTAAHRLLEVALRLEQPPEKFEGTSIHTHNEHGSFTVDAEMIEAVGQAYDYATQWYRAHPHGHVLIEQRVHWGKHKALKLDEDIASGTGDMILVDHTPATRWLEITDYKHGAGVQVEVVRNSQLWLYAVGVIVDYPDHEDIHTTIIQPRSRHEDGPVRTAKISAKVLNNWVRKEVAPAAQRALDPDASDTKAGEWCRWCPAKAECPTLVARIYAAAQTEFGPVAKVKPKEPARLTPAQMSQALDSVELLESWAKELRARALQMLKNGEDIPKYKLVRGKQGNRTWVEQYHDDVRKLCAKLKLKQDEYEPRSLLSVAQLENVFKAAKRVEEFASFNAMFSRSEAGLHVAPESDPRPKYQPGAEFSKIKQK